MKSRPQNLRASMPCVVTVGVFVATCMTAHADEADEIEQRSAIVSMKHNLIDNLTSAELLYEDLDMLVEKVYTLVDKGSWSDEALIELNMIRTETRTMEFISQNGRIFNEIGIERTMFGIDETENLVSRDGYDGERTIVYSPPIVNIIEGPVEGIQRFRPHMLPFAWTGGLRYRLSTILDGSCRHCITPRNRERVIHSIAKIERDGEEFIELRLNTIESESGKPLVGWTELQFSPTHNYLPIRGVGYAADFTTEFPTYEFEMDELDEIEPGTFFPGKFIERVYDSGDARRGVKTLGNVTIWEFKRVSLNPNHPKSKFSDIAYPADATVHYIRNGEIIRTETPGATGKNE